MAWLWRSSSKVGQSVSSPGVRGEGAPTEPLQAEFPPTDFRAEGTREFSKLKECRSEVCRAAIGDASLPARFWRKAAASRPPGTPFNKRTATSWVILPARGAAARTASASGGRKWNPRSGEEVESAIGPPSGAGGMPFGGPSLPPGASLAAPPPKSRRGFPFFPPPRRVSPGIPAPLKGTPSASASLRAAAVATRAASASSSALRSAAILPSWERVQGVLRSSSVCQAIALGLGGPFANICHWQPFSDPLSSDSQGDSQGQILETVKAR